jgi:hypothetical protein
MEPTMKSKEIRADLLTLVEEAKRSKDGEAYTTLKTGAHFRLGVGARIDPNGEVTSFLYLLLTPEGREIEITIMESKIALLKRLSEMGYDASGEEDGSISCEIIVTVTDVAKKYNLVLDALAEAKLGK